MKKILFILIITFFGCSKNDKEMNYNTFVLNNKVEVNILDKDGNDLLNSHYSFEYMKLYYIIDNNKIEVLNEQLDNPRNLKLINNVNPYGLRIYTNDGLEEFIEEKDRVKYGESINLLELNGNETDTIKTEWISVKDKYFKVTKIWYNSIPFETDKIIQIIKE